MAIAVRNTPGQTVGEQMLTLTGADYVGGVLVYVTGDDGPQVLGAAGGGVAEAKGNGYYTYTPTQAETDFAWVAFTFTGVGAVTRTVEGPTETAGQAAAVASTVIASATTRTAKDLIKAAFRRINVFDATTEIPGEDMVDAFTMLNDLIDSWNTESLLVSVMEVLSFPLLPFTATRTIGPTGNVIAAIPPSIHVATIMPVGTTQEIPISVMTRDQYALIPNKALTNVWPTGVLYELTPGNATLTFAPIPTTAAVVTLYVDAVLSQFATMTTPYSFNNGYIRAIRDNLAIELAPGYERATVSPLVQASAIESKRNIKMANVTVTDLVIDRGALGGSGGGGRGMYNILTDQ